MPRSERRLAGSVGGENVRRLVVGVDAHGRVGYRYGRARRRWTSGESLAGCCARLSADELVLPAGTFWPHELAELVADLDHRRLPEGVRLVDVDGRRLDLADPVGAAAWAFVVAAVAGRVHVQSTNKAGVPEGLPSARTAPRASAKSTTEPSPASTTS